MVKVHPTRYLVKVYFFSQKVYLRVRERKKGPGKGAEAGAPNPHFFPPILRPPTLRLQLCEYSSVGAPGGRPDAIEAEPRHAVGARARVLCHSADEGLHRELLAVLADPLVRVRVRARARVRVRV